MVVRKTESTLLLVFWIINLINLKLLFKKICIASDHAGFDIKEYIKDFFVKKNISIIDLGPNDDKSVDYPDYAKKVGNRLKSKKSDVGILVCGSGTGMAISANKIRGMRAALCYNASSTRLSRMHNDANIITLGSRLTKKKDIIKLLLVFLNTKFEGGRHLRRVKKI
jgi:ribose 5-phosphate isomerase B